jgi:membrane dipeptidase
MAISRRDFVERAGAAALLGTVAHQPSPLAPSAEPQATSGVWIDGLSATRLGPEGLAEIAKSGLTVMETTLGPAGNPTFSHEAAVQDLARWHGNFAKYPDNLIHIRRSADILQARREGKLGVLLGFQNATHLDRDIRNVEFFYNLGIRQIQLTYNELNALGAGSTERKDVGLSDFGVEVVEKMNALGILVDVSHCGVQTTLDAIEVSKKPIIFSHSNCRALNDNPRCKSDEQIRKLAAKGGVMGITTVNFFVSKKPRSTLDDYIAHIEHVAKLVGIDHVAIGTDSSIGGWRISFPTEKAFWDFHSQFKFKPGVDIKWPPFIEEIDVPEKMYIIQRRLASKGFSSTDIDKVLGGNFFRVYQEIIG